MLRKIEFSTLEVVDNITCPMRGCHYQIKSFMGNGFSVDAARALLNLVCNIPSECGPPVSITKYAILNLVSTSVATSYGHMCL